MKIIIEVLIFLLQDKMMDYINLMHQGGEDIKLDNEPTVEEKLYEADKLLLKLNSLKGGEKNGYNKKDRIRSSASESGRA